ncbi:hypothetical protein SCA6_018182 [Theobroma cacao]
MSCFIWETASLQTCTLQIFWFSDYPMMSELHEIFCTFPAFGGSEPVTAIGLALCLVSPPVMLGNFTRLPGATENTRRFMLGNFTRLLGATEIREDLCDCGLILPNCLIPGPFQVHCKWIKDESC